MNTVFNHIAIPDLGVADGWLPLFFAAAMALAMLIYVVLDGFDLGVALLMPAATEPEKDRIVNSIGPYWDANETWLVLGAGLLLAAFPKAHGIVLRELYLPATLMLWGLILRGAAFDFRIKARDEHKHWWNTAFIAGSAIAAWAQGYMLGGFVTGFAKGAWMVAFQVLIGVCLMAAYAALGATWLLVKVEGDLQQKAIAWARRSMLWMAAGIGAISLVTPWISADIRARWFAADHWIWLWPLPVLSLVLLWWLWRSLNRLAALGSAGADTASSAKPFVATIGVMLLAALGLGYSLFPWVVPESLTFWQAASSTESLWVLFIGTVAVLPIMMLFSAWSYYVFRGKSPAQLY